MSLIGISFFLLSFSCQKDFSAISKKIPNNKPDTTSHDFSWKIDTLGELSSTLNDISVISESDIWAVGEIHTPDTDKFDSLGHWIPPFNAAHWDGQEWKMVRTEAPGYGFGTNFSVYTFEPNNIWIGGGIPQRWDGNSWTFYGSSSGYPGGFRINKIWGTSSSNLYFVGDEGNIFHYNGSTWQKLSNGTNIDLYDVWGSPDGELIWACGYSSNYSESILLQYNGSDFRTVWQGNFQQGITDSTYEGLLSSLWVVDSDSLIVIGGDGIFYQDIQGNAPPLKSNINLNAFPNSVRGSAPNNIFIVGFDGSVWHYNGSTWKTYPELRNPKWVFKSVAVLDNKVVAVGLDYSHGIQREIILTGLKP